MDRFVAELEIIDGNPFVAVPDDVLANLFAAAGRDKGPIPIRGAVNSEPYQQTLVKFRGEWRLYINMKMLPDSPRRIGESIAVEVEFDPSDRSILVPEKFVAALDRHPEAKVVFDGLAPSRQKEIVRYLATLKSADKLEHNIDRAINFLLGKGRFVGRDSP